MKTEKICPDPPPVVEIHNNFFFFRMNPSLSIMRLLYYFCYLHLSATDFWNMFPDNFFLYFHSRLFHVCLFGKIWKLKLCLSAKNFIYLALYIWQKFPSRLYFTFLFAHNSSFTFDIFHKNLIIIYLKTLTMEKLLMSIVLEIKFQLWKSLLELKI